MSAQLAHGIDPADAIRRLKVRLAELPNVVKTPPPQVEMRLLLEGNADTARDVPTVLDPAKLVTLQLQVDRVTIETSLLSYTHALVQATRNAPVLSLNTSTHNTMALARAARARSCRGSRRSRRQVRN